MAGPPNVNLSPCKAEQGAERTYDQAHGEEGFETLTS